MKHAASTKAKAHDLVSQLVDLSKEAERYFQTKGKENPLLIDMAYAREPIPAGREGYAEQNPGLPNYPFGAMYKKTAKMWAQKDLAAITIRTAEILYQTQGWKLKVMDCLRTVEAQEMMQNVVKESGWSEEYVGKPGVGGHPRGMAIDIVPIDARTHYTIDMGSEFDHFGERSNRDFTAFSDDEKVNKAIIDHRRHLDNAMLTATKEQGLEGKLLLYPAEWWDYRFVEEIWGAYPPLSEADLPKEMRLTQ